ncbi:MAG: hypothetical protein ABUT20_29460 [Bacteroidota bacterium]
MEFHDFSFSVLFKGEQIELQAQLRKSAYSWRIAVFMGDHEVIFEPGEDGELRAVMMDEKVTKKIDPDLVKAVAEALADALK